jgi:lipoprotein-anchoring transpeptidase ErfK/SrfK
MSRARREGRGRARRAVGRLAIGVALLTGALAAGCLVEDDGGEAATDAASAIEDGVVETPSDQVYTASTPFTDYDRVDPALLERERLEESWREAARRDWQERAAAPAPPRPALPPVPEPETAEPITRPATPAETPGATAENGSSPRQEAGKAAPLPRAARDPGQRAPDPAPVAAADPARPERWEDITPEALVRDPARLPIDREGGGATALRVQWLLDRAGFSPGVIDGHWGKNTEKAVFWLQERLGLEPTGRVDPDLYRRLVAEVGGGEPVRSYTVTREDLAGPFTRIPEETAAKAELDCLCYESPAELLAERFHTTPELLARLNPEADLARPAAGTELWVPAVEVVEPPRQAAGDGERDAGAVSGAETGEVDRIVVSRRGFYLHALDASGRILRHFPTTVGSRYDPSLDGTFRVTGIAWRPDFHYQPKLFSDVPDTDEELMLPPGPNSPVGMVWIQLSEDGYGIHGSAQPETLGYTASHGCVRLANWDAITLARMVAQGVPVAFRE